MTTQQQQQQQRYDKDDGEYYFSTDNSLLEVDMIHDYLTRESYWSQAIPFEVVRKSIDNSLCFGIYLKEEEERDEQGTPTQRHRYKQIAFGRAITDRATFAYLADVFVLSEHRKRGLGKKLVGFIMAHPDLQGLRGIMLATKDAHGLYSQFGFKPLENPERLMRIHDPDIYINNAKKLLEANNNQT